MMSKFDILSALEDKGLDHIVLQILNYLNPRELLITFQVSKAWSECGDDILWRRKLRQNTRKVTWMSNHMLETGFQTKSDKEKCLLMEKLRCNYCAAKADIKKCDVGSTVLSLCLLGDTCLVGLNNGYLQEWTLDGQLVRESDLHLKGIKTVVKGINETIITASYDGCVTIWTNKDWILVRRVSVGVSITEIVCDKQNKDNNVSGNLYICGDQGHISQYQILPSGDLPVLDNLLSDRVPEPLPVWKLQEGDMVNALAVYNNLKVLVSGNDGGDLCVRNITDGSIERKLEGHQTGCGITHLIKDDNLLWSSSFDTTIRSWATKDWTCLAVLSGHTHPVRSIQVTSDCVISGDYRGFIMIWDKHIIQAEVIKHKRDNKSTNLSTKHEEIYKIRSGRLLKPRQACTAEVLHHTTFLEHSSHVTSIQSSPGHLVSGSRDKSIIIHTFCKDLSRKKKIKTRQSYFDNFSIY